MTCVVNVVSPRIVVNANGGGDVGGVLGDRVVRRWKRSEDGLLKCV